MAIKLSANYSKKLGLPKFSSHSFSVSVEVELVDLSQVEEESQRLYQLLQQSVDKEIQNTGFVPGNPVNGTHSPRNGQANANGHSYHVNESHGPVNSTNGHAQPHATRTQWNCTDGQKTMILRIVEENPAITKPAVEDLSQQLFRVGVTQLNKMQASQLIEDLLVMAGKPPIRSRWQKQRPTTQAA